MKKLRIALGVVCLALLCLILPAGCNKNAIASPKNLRIDPITLTLNWTEVKDAGYYTVQIRGEKETVQKDTSRNRYSLESLTEGEYTIRVKALARSDSGRSDSSYSATVRFTREHETGLAFRPINRNTAFEVSGLGSASGNLVIPDTYRGLPVTRIGDRAFYNKSTAVTGVTFGSNITEIGKQAFTNCSFLLDIALPSGLKSIGEQAFQSCRLLRSKIVIPDTVTAVAAQAFEYCQSIPEIDLGKGVTSIGTGAFNGCAALTKIVVPDQVISVGESAFSGCKTAKTLSLGKNVASVGKSAFSGCVSLTSVTLGEKVREVGESAFQDCIALKTLNMTDSVLSIGKAAFKGCTVLETVLHLSNNLTRIAEEAFLNTALWETAEHTVYVGNWFLGCKDDDMSQEAVREGTVGIADFAFFGVTKFTDPIVELPASVERIGAYAFAGCTRLINVSIGSRTRVIGERAFNGCTGLSIAVLGSYDGSAGTKLGESSLETIGEFAFDGCTDLNEIVIPETVTVIGSYAFRDTGMYASASREVYAGNWLVGVKKDAGYGSVNVLDGTVGIANYAFYNCKNVTEVTIPDSVQTIGRSAFYNCTALTSVKLPAGLAVIEDYTFYHCDMLRMPALPATLTKIGRSAFYACALVGVAADTDEDTLVIPDSVTSIGDYAFYKSGYAIVNPVDPSATIAGGIDVLSIGSGVKEIGANAFANIATLKRAELGGVERIGERAFYKCAALESVTFGNSVATIGNRAFYGCSSLKTAYLPASVKTIDSYAFYNCVSLEEATLGSAEKIGDYAFYGCGALKNVRFSAGLKEIGKQAFRKCTGIKSIVLSADTKVGAHAFYGAEITVYTDATEPAEGWDARWNSGYRPVVWGCTLAEDGSVKSFTKTAGSVQNVTKNSPLAAPERAGYEFAGWATEENGDPLYSAETVEEAENGTVLYAVWTPSV